MIAEYQPQADNAFGLKRSFLYNTSIGKNSKKKVEKKIPQSKIRLLTLDG